MKNLRTAELWDELVSRHEGGECIYNSMPSYIEDLAIEQFDNYQDGYEDGWDEAIAESDTQVLIDELEERDESLTKIIFDYSGTLQEEYVNNKIEEIKSALTQYTYLKAS